MDSGCPWPMMVSSSQSPIGRKGRSTTIGHSSMLQSAGQVGYSCHSADGSVSGTVGVDIDHHPRLSSWRKNTLVNPSMTNRDINFGFKPPTNLHRAPILSEPLGDIGPGRLADRWPDLGWSRFLGQLLRRLRPIATKVGIRMDFPANCHL